MVEVNKDIGIGGPAWTEGAEARLERRGDGFALAVSVPEFGGEMVLRVGPDGASGGHSLNLANVWKDWAGEDYGVQKEIYWQLAGLLMDALTWVRKVCPEAGFPELEPSDWRETDFGWLAEKDGLFVRLDPEDGLAVWEDPFGR